MPSTSGGAVPLREIATPRLTSAPARIFRDRQQRFVSVTAQVAPGFLTAKVNAAVFAALAKQVTLPSGYSFQAGGEAEASQRAFGGLYAFGEGRGFFSIGSGGLSERHV